jgi:signal transduction histidine kinase
MLPNTVLHKRNGHRHLPERPMLSPGDLVSLVHSAPTPVSDLDPGLLKFAAIIQSECAAPDAVAGDRSALPPGVARAVARGREALARGEMPDVRAALDALGAQADIAAALVARLAETVQASGSRPHRPAQRALISMNALLVDTLGRFSGRAPDMATTALCLDPRLPYIAGDRRQLQEVVLVCIRAVARVHQARGRPGLIRVETSRYDGVLRGESVVRVVMTDDWRQADAKPVPLPAEPLPASPAQLDLCRAARTVKEHGGVLSVARVPGGGTRFTLEFPAV